MKLHLGQPQQNTNQIITTQPSDIIPSTAFMKAPATKLPQLKTEITHPQFCKFKMNWNVFKQITNIPPNQLHAQFYNSCTDTSFVNTNKPCKHSEQFF